MKRIILPSMSTLHLATVILLAGWLTGSALAQSSNQGIVTDWSTHHVIFSNPGTLQDAMKNGRRKEWERIVSDPRYQMQQIRRGRPMAGQTAVPKVGLPRARQDSSPGSGAWETFLANPGTGVGIALNAAPAKYNFSLTGPLNCSDYVVFPVNVAGTPGFGGTAQANLVGVNEIYTPACGPAPITQFAYAIGNGGTITTSPVLSLDGTKVAFVESGAPGGSIFHVLTLGTNGNPGCALFIPGLICNGNQFNNARAPGGAFNNAVDTPVPLFGATTDTRSSPFVDYQDDIAYVGDDGGNLHKITGVFLGTPTEVTTGGWPVTSLPGPLSSPIVAPFGPPITLNPLVYTNYIFVGGNDGNLYCFSSDVNVFSIITGGLPCLTARVPVGGGGSPIYGPPTAVITSITTGTVAVFASANEGGTSFLSQSLWVLGNSGSPTNVNMGAQGGNASQMLHRGAFDNEFLNSSDFSTGHMYFCGNGEGGSSGNPTLYRVGFSSTGVMNGTRDANSFPLATVNTQCSALLSIFNITDGIDRLFLGVQDNGSGSPIVMSFVLPSNGSFPAAPITSNFTQPIPPFIALPGLPPPGGSVGISDMIIDNVVDPSGGGSNIYFGNSQRSSGIQLSQSALQ